MKSSCDFYAFDAPWVRLNTSRPTGWLTVPWTHQAGPASEILFLLFHLSLMFLQHGLFLHLLGVFAQCYLCSEAFLHQIEHCNTPFPLFILLPWPFSIVFICLIFHLFLIGILLMAWHITGTIVGHTKLELHQVNVHVFPCLQAYMVAGKQWVLNKYLFIGGGMKHL
jgi:hypothetical protein